MDRIKGYAAGLFEIARAEGELERVQDELFHIARTVESSTELRDALADPRVPHDRKQGIVDDLLGRRASDTTTRLVSFVVAQGRSSELPEIADELVARAAAERDQAVAEVRSAIPLDDETVARLAHSLGRATGKRVDVRVVVDPSVLGGVVARVGDTVIDGSVRRRLDSLRQTLTR